jgi:hypothetical protein
MYFFSLCFPATQNQLGLHNTLMLHRIANGQRMTRYLDVRTCTAAGCAFTPWVPVVAPPPPPPPECRLDPVGVKWCRCGESWNLQWCGPF